MLVVWCSLDSDVSFCSKEGVLEEIYFNYRRIIRYRHRGKSGGWWFKYFSLSYLAALYLFYSIIREKNESMAVYYVYTAKIDFTFRLSYLFIWKMLRQYYRFYFLLRVDLTVWKDYLAISLLFTLSYWLICYSSSKIDKDRSKICFWDLWLKWVHYDKTDKKSKNCIYYFYSEDLDFFYMICRCCWRIQGLCNNSRNSYCNWCMCRSILGG